MCGGRQRVPNSKRVGVSLNGPLSGTLHKSEVWLRAHLHWTSCAPNMLASVDTRDEQVVIANRVRPLRVRKLVGPRPCESSVTPRGRQYISLRALTFFFFPPERCHAVRRGFLPLRQCQRLFESLSSRDHGFA